MLMSVKNFSANTDRVLQVLATLARHGQAMSVVELMQKTGMSRSTLYRQLARMKAWGLVTEVHANYAPGPLSLQLALGFEIASGLRQAARAEMQTLAQASQESVALVIAVHDQAVCVDAIESSQSTGGFVQRGQSQPLQEGASAKCLMAHLPTAQSHTLLDMLHAPGSAAWQHAAQELQTIRKTGYARVTRLGLWSVSVPLFDAPHRAAGAVTLMVPVSRARERSESMTQMTVVTAARISRKLIKG